MPRWPQEIEDDDDNHDHGRNEDPLESDMDDDPFDNTTPCPYCRKSIYEEFEFCPHCGKYITEEVETPVRKTTWIIVGVVLAVIGAALWMRI